MMKLPKLEITSEKLQTWNKNILNSKKIYFIFKMFTTKPEIFHFVIVTPSRTTKIWVKKSEGLKTNFRPIFDAELENHSYFFYTVKLLGIESFCLFSNMAKKRGKKHLFAQNFLNNCT